jgi:uncharacterized protein (DUF952 family)
VTLLHIAVRSEWEAGGGGAETAAPSKKGVVATAARYYAGRDDVVLLEIDESKLTAPLVVEPSPSTGDLFPHIYGPIDRAAVVAVHEFPPDAHGGFSLPSELRS